MATKKLLSHKPPLFGRSRACRCSVSERAVVWTVLLILLGMHSTVPRLLAVNSPFLVAPYVQIGDSPRNLTRERLVVLWHSSPELNGWSVRYREKGSTGWRAASDLRSVPVA